MTLLTLAFVAIVIAILSWSAGTALLLWAARLKRLEELEGGGAVTEAPAAAVADPVNAVSDVPSVEDNCATIAAGLDDVALRETALMLTALAEHGRVMVASRDPGREELARRVVDDLATRSAELGMGPPITATDGEVVGAAVFRAADGLGTPLLRAAEWELASRSATVTAAAD